MKKERIVALCLCAVLLGTLHAQWIAWACRIAMPSMAQFVRPKGALAEFVSAAWPPVGFAYREVRMVMQKSREIPGNPSEPVQYLSLQSSRKCR